MLNFLECKHCQATSGFCKTQEGYICKHCGSFAYVDNEGESVKATKEAVASLSQTITDGIQSVLDKIDQERQNTLGIALYNLRTEIEKECPDSDMISKYCHDVKQIEPEHFFANICEMLVGGNYRELNEYLIDYDVKKIPKKMINNAVIFLSNHIRTNFSTGLTAFLEKSLPEGLEKKELYSYIEEQTEKITSGEYDPTISRDVFVACSSKDIAQASKIVENLERQGIKCWIYTRNLRKGINSGREYETNIKTAIENCTVFLLIGSDNSRSDDCDAYSVELKYVIKLDRQNQLPENRYRPAEWDITLKKPRVQYMLTDYRSQYNPYDREISKFFSGFNNVYGEKDLIDSIMDSKSYGSHETGTPTPLTRKDRNEEIKRKSEKERIAREREETKRKKKEARLARKKTEETRKTEISNKEEKGNASKQVTISPKKKKILAITMPSVAVVLIAVIVVTCVFVTKSKDTVSFGSYPQTKVTDTTVTAALNTAIDWENKKPENGNNNGWTSYKYYISGSNSTDFMWYIDKEYDGNKYRGVYFTSYRPYYTTSSSSAGNSCQDDNGYSTSTIYWFKYEPIKWRILTESSGTATLLAELIIDSQQYDYDGSYSNNYADSTIRAWLNDTFYNTSFTSTQQALIQTVEVDNSARSTNPDSNATEWNSGTNTYACSNTNDKVWLLSEQEVTKSAYGFKTSYSAYDTARQKKTSDYAQCQGAYTSISTGYVGNGGWWLRSPYCNDCSSARGVYGGGYADYNSSVCYTNGGVSPALVIRLS